jgi:polyribonucleotide nucleotidyltransferase
MIEQTGGLQADQRVAGIADQIVPTSTLQVRRSALFSLSRFHAHSRFQ